MSTNLAPSSQGRQSRVLAELLNAQRQLDDAKQLLSAAKANRDRHVACAVRVGFSHTEVAQRIGLERSEVSQLLRRRRGSERDASRPSALEATEQIVKSRQP